MLLQFTEAADTDSQGQAHCFVTSLHAAGFSIIIKTLPQSCSFLVCSNLTFSSSASAIFLYITSKKHIQHTPVNTIEKMDTTDYFQRYQQVSSLEKSKNALIEVVFLAFGRYRTRTFLLIVPSSILGSPPARDTARRSLLTSET